jgi:hypothetical protein
MEISQLCGQWHVPRWDPDGMAFVVGFGFDQYWRDSFLWERHQLFGSLVRFCFLRHWINKQ